MALFVNLCNACDCHWNLPMQTMSYKIIHAHSTYTYNFIHTLPQKHIHLISTNGSNIDTLVSPHHRDLNRQGSSHGYC